MILFFPLRAFINFIILIDFVNSAPSYIFFFNFLFFFAFNQQWNLMLVRWQ